MCTWTHSSASSVCRVQCCSCCLPSHCVCIVLRTFVVVQRLGTVHAYFSTAGEHSKCVLHDRVEVELSAAGEHSRCVLYIKSALDSDASDRRPIWSSKVCGRLKMAAWAVAVLCGAQGSDQVRCCSVAWLWGPCVRYSPSWPGSANVFYACRVKAGIQTLHRGISSRDWPSGDCAYYWRVDSSAAQYSAPWSALSSFRCCCSQGLIRVVGRALSSRRSSGVWGMQLCCLWQVLCLVVH